MRIDITIIRVLDLIDRYGSITKAAEIMNKVPSGLSHTIAKAEKRFHAKLLVPEGRTVVVSPVGLALLEDGRKLLQSLEKLERKIINYESGAEESFNVGIDTNINCNSLLELMSKYYGNQPKATLNLVQKPSAQLINDVIARKIHFAIGFNFEKVNANKNVMSKQLMSQPMGLALSKKHLLYAQIREAPDFTAFPWQHLTWVTQQYYDLLLYPHEVRQYMINLFPVPDVYAQIKAIALGLGIGFVPINELSDHGGDVEVVYKNPNWQKTFFAAWNTQRMEKALRWFVRQLENVSTRTALVTNKKIMTTIGVD